MDGAGSRPFGPTLCGRRRRLTPAPPPKPPPIVAHGRRAGERRLHRLPQARGRHWGRAVRGGGLLPELPPAQLPRVSQGVRGRVHAMSVCGFVGVMGRGRGARPPARPYVYHTQTQTQPTTHYDHQLTKQGGGRLLLLRGRGRGARAVHLPRHGPGPVRFDDFVYACLCGDMGTVRGRLTDAVPLHLPKPPLTPTPNPPSKTPNPTGKGSAPSCVRPAWRCSRPGTRSRTLRSSPSSAPSSSAGSSAPSCTSHCSRALVGVGVESGVMG